MATSSAPRVGILGAAGRMGRTLIEAVWAAGPELQLAAAVEWEGHPELGRDIAGWFGRDATGVVLSADWSPASVDVLIDFTRPHATLATVEKACRSGTAMVIGTTGFDADGRRALEAAATQIALCESGNFSLGVYLLQRLVQDAAATLGSDFDIEIVEAHHRHKVDAPSGTALMLGEAAARGRGVRLADVSDRGRDGITGPREAGAIGFHAIRGGDFIGEHDVIFAGPGERIVLRHVASDRALFARGALRAALWAQGQPHGEYSMIDVLGL